MYRPCILCPLSLTLLIVSNLSMSIPVHGFSSSWLRTTCQYSSRHQTSGHDNNDGKIGSSSRLFLAQQQPQSPLSGSTTKTTTTTKKKTTQGVYVRPSGAIERGSGFFVPGLEGPRVRFVVGTVLLLLTAINHFLLPSATTVEGGATETSLPVMTPSSLEEGLAVTYSLLILFQAAIEYFKEVRSFEQQQQQQQQDSSVSVSASSSQVVQLPQKWSTVTPSLDDDSSENQDSLLSYQEKIQWSAASFLAMTPANTVLLLTNRNTDAKKSTGTVPSPQSYQILYQLGGTIIDNDDDNGNNSNEQTQSGIRAALDQVNQSKGGRISLPLTHPSVEVLMPYLSVSYSQGQQQQGEKQQSQKSPRTIILQRITDHSCLMISSDQLLASFTPNDLQWLGQLAEYVRA